MSLSVSGEGAGVSGHRGRRVEIEAGIFDHLFDRMPGMDAGEREAAIGEAEQAAVGHQRDRSTGTIDISSLAPGALMKSTLGTSVRRECSVRNRMTFGTT